MGEGGEPRSGLWVDLSSRTKVRIRLVSGHHLQPERGEKQEAGVWNQCLSSHSLAGRPGSRETEEAESQYVDEGTSIDY